MCARFENHRKIASNALLERVTPLRSLEKRDFRVSERQNGSRGLSGVPWKPPGAPLVPSRPPTSLSWRALGHSWPLLGRSWAALGPHLEPLGRVLGLTFSLLGASATAPVPAPAQCQRKRQCLAKVPNSYEVLRTPCRHRHYLCVVTSCASRCISTGVR